MITCVDPVEQQRIDEHLEKCKRVKPGNRISEAKRQGIITLINRGHSTNGIKRAMHASELTINRIRKQIEQEGSDARK